MNNPSSYLPIFVALLNLTTENYKDGEDLMKKIDFELKKHPRDVVFWCLRGLVQKKYWELDHDFFFEKVKGGIVPFYRRKLPADHKPEIYFFHKALEVEPENKEIKKLFDAEPKEININGKMVSWNKD